MKILEYRLQQCAMERLIDPVGGPVQGVVQVEDSVD